MQQTPAGVLAHIKALSGIDVAEAFARPDLDKEIKWHTRYARQNGIHVSPTFMVNGLVRPELGSGDTIEKWLEALG
jgi:protein-disulfide isomerase